MLYYTASGKKSIGYELSLNYKSIIVWCANAFEKKYEPKGLGGEGSPTPAGLFCFYLMSMSWDATIFHLSEDKFFGGLEVCTGVDEPGYHVLLGMEISLGGGGTMAVLWLILQNAKTFKTSVYLEAI